MRISTKSFPVETTVSIQKAVATESILQIKEDKLSKEIVVYIGYYDIEGSLMVGKSTVVSGDFYDLLMSSSPDFAPGKPENEYRETDLWYIIDLLETS